jgi:Holliday junction DNA helicase RuvA
MFDFIAGKVVERAPTHLVLDVGGVGYRFDISVNTFEALPAEGERAKVFVHLAVQDDRLRLFGFASRQEREVFRMLTSISGIGPATALTILSGVSVEEFCQAVVSEDSAYLRRIRGIGPKTAQRIVVELADTLRYLSADREAVLPPQAAAVNDAVMALVSLGYGRRQAEKAVSRAVSELGGQTAVQELVKRALNYV